MIYVFRGAGLSGTFVVRRCLDLKGESGIILNKVNVDKILSKKLKPHSPHILDIFLRLHLKQHLHRKQKIYLKTNIPNKGNHTLE